MAKVTASSLYESKRRGELFDEAYKLFPDHNDEQADDAADFIFEHLLDDVGEDDEIDEPERDELYEMIVAGLT